MRFNFLKQKYVSRKIINAINVLQFFIYKNGANQPFAFDLWWLLLNINHSAWCSKSARLLVRDRLGSNCVRKKSARVLLGSKVARNFSARSAILIEDDRIEMLEQLKFLLVNNPNADASFSSTNRRKEKPEKGDFYFLSQMDANAKKGA